MKCRHCDTPWEHAWEYCPQCERNCGGAKCPATQTDEKLREIGLLLERIRTAFAGVVLGGGETIHQAHLEGMFGGTPRWAEEREKDRETDWSDVADWKLERGFSTLYFFNVEGWRFYLPAFMSWSLRNWRTTDSITTDAIVWNLAFDKWGTPLTVRGDSSRSTKNSPKWFTPSWTSSPSTPEKPMQPRLSDRIGIDSERINRPRRWPQSTGTSLDASTIAAGSI